MALVSLNLLSLRHQILCHLSLPTYLFALDLPQHSAAPPARLPLGTRLEFCSPSPSFPFMCPGSGVEWDFESSIPWRKGHRLWSKSDLAPNPASAIISHRPWENFWTSENFLTSLNFSFCFYTMRIKLAHRVVVKNKQDEKCWVSNPQSGNLRRELVWLGGNGWAVLVGRWSPHTGFQSTLLPTGWRARGTAGTMPRVHKSPRGPEKCFKIILITMTLIFF